MIEGRYGYHGLLIEARSNLLPSRLSIDYEARARVAILEKDPGAARRYVELATREAEGGAAFLVTKHSRLLHEARHAGLMLDMPATVFENSVLGDRPRLGVSSLASVTIALAAMPDGGARARRALELMCEASRAVAGHLFFRRADELVPVAAIGAPADEALIESARQWWRQQLASADLDDVVTGDLAIDDAAHLTIRSEASGVDYRIAALKSETTTRVAHLGLVLLAPNDAGELAPEYWPISAAIVARLLEHADVEPVYKVAQ